MAANQTSAGARPPREGSALCQGIIYCGCGRHMGVTTRTAAPTTPAAPAPDRQATPGCQHASAATIDAAVTQALFTAIAPDELALAIAAAGEVTARRQRATRAAELAAERARYQADRAERAFTACEPENRLVARTLETRWEARLAELADAQAALAAQLPAAGPAPRARPARRNRGTAARALARAHHQRQRPQAAAAHPPRRHHPHARRRPRQAEDRPALELRRHRRTAHRALPAALRTSPAAVDLARQLGPAMNNNRPRRRAQRRRPPHRPRPPLRPRLSRQPPPVPQDQLPPGSQRRRAHHPPGRRKTRRLRSRPSNTGSTTATSPHAADPAGAGRSRSRPTSKPPAANAPPAPSTSTKTSDRATPRRRAQHHRNRRPARHQPAPHLRLDQTRHPAPPAADPEPGSGSP